MYEEYHTCYDVSVHVYVLYTCTHVRTVHVYRGAYCNVLKHVPLWSIMQYDVYVRTYVHVYQWYCNTRYREKGTRIEYHWYVTCCTHPRVPWYHMVLTLHHGTRWSTYMCTMVLTPVRTMVRTRVRTLVPRYVHVYVRTYVRTYFSTYSTYVRTMVCHTYYNVMSHVYVLYHYGTRLPGSTMCTIPMVRYVHVYVRTYNSTYVPLVYYHAGKAYTFTMVYVYHWCPSPLRQWCAGGSESVGVCCPAFAPSLNWLPCILPQHT